MAGFSEIIGHEQIIEHLQNAIRLNKVSHAYILEMCIRDRARSCWREILSCTPS